MELNASFDHPLLAEIEKSEFLRTHLIKPVVGNFLEVQVGVAEAIDQTLEMAGIMGVKALEITPRSKKYTFYFSDFVAYSVRDELYAEYSENENSIGGKISLYSSSNYLEFVKSSTWATDDHPGKLLHFQINTLDHTIDVVSATPANLKAIA